VLLYRVLYMDVNSGDESPEDREYRRFLGKSASKDRKRKGATFTSPAQKIGSNGSSQPALQGTPPLSSKAANDYIDDHEEGLSRNVFQPGAPGYIEPGSTPDKSVFDKIRLFAQRSAIAEPHNHKELFGPGGTSSKARDAQEGRFDDKQPPKSRQVEQLLRQSRAESANVRKRGVRDVKKRGKSPNEGQIGDVHDAPDPASETSAGIDSGSAAPTSHVDNSQGRSNRRQQQVYLIYH